VSAVQKRLLKDCREDQWSWSGVRPTGYRFDNVPEASQSVPYRYAQGSLVDTGFILGMERESRHFDDNSNKIMERFDRTIGTSRR
jgi:hypothetical protein